MSKGRRQFNGKGDATRWLALAATMIITSMRKKDVNNR